MGDEIEKRDFKGVWIPKNVWLDTRLNALEKVILIEIDSLDNGERGCYASNEHLAEFCQCSKTKVSTAITKLIKCGYLYVQNFDGRKRELKSRLSNFERQNIKNCKAEYQNLKESNIESNTDNNKERVYKQVVDLFNETCVSFPHVTALSDRRKRAIHARLKTYTMEDFKRCFEIAEASDFLKGKNNRDWSANFDWMIKDANMAKILDGNYTDHRQQTARQTAEQPHEQKPKEINVDDFRRADGTIDCDAYMKAQYS